jgi:hypothetical protein
MATYSDEQIMAAGRAALGTLDNSEEWYSSISGHFATDFAFSLVAAVFSAVASIPGHTKEISRYITESATRLRDSQKQDEEERAAAREAFGISLKAAFSTPEKKAEIIAGMHTDTTEVESKDSSEEFRFIPYYGPAESQSPTRAERIAADAALAEDRAAQRAEDRRQGRRQGHDIAN